MKKLLTALLALTLTLTLAIPALAVETPPLMPGEVIFEPDISDIFLRNAPLGLTSAIQYLNERTMVPAGKLITSLGGTYEYQNGKNTVILRLEGKSLVLSNGADTMDVWENGSVSHVTLDAVPYIDGELYVPVRFVTEALGYDVVWNSYYGAATLLDRENIINELDSGYTILNRLLTSGMTRSQGTVKGDVSADVAMTFYDTIKGDTKLNLSLDAAVITDGESVSMTLSLDLDDLARFLEANSEELFYDETEAAEVAAVLSKLGGSDAEVIIDAKNGRAYMHVAAINALFAATGAQLAESDWIAMDIEDLGLYSPMPLDGELSVLAGADTVGEYLYNTYSGYGLWAYNYMISDTVSVFSDANFTPVTGGYRFKLESEEGYELSYSADVLLRTSGDEIVGVEGTLKALNEDYYGYSATAVDAEFSFSAENVSVRVVYQVRNQMKLELNVTGSAREYAGNVPSAPPAGASVVEFE